MPPSYCTLRPPVEEEVALALILSALCAGEHTVPAPPRRSERRPEEEGTRAAFVPGAPRAVRQPWHDRTLSQPSRLFPISSPRELVSLRAAHARELAETRVAAPTMASDEQNRLAKAQVTVVRNGCTSFMPILFDNALARAGHRQNSYVYRQLLPTSCSTFVLTTPVLATNACGRRWSCSLRSFAVHLLLSAELQHVPQHSACVPWRSQFASSSKKMLH